MAELLSYSQVDQELESLPNWQRAGDALQRSVKLKDFRESIALVNSIAELAEAADHHPDITINYNQVHLELSTHSEGGLTAKDTELARQIEQAISAGGR